MIGLLITNSHVSRENDKIIYNTINDRFGVYF